ncbi:MAG TPA: hypothetical protein VF735_07635 [Pyrinomonadaceae bacterium]
MRKMKRVMAIMLLAMVASVCAPQAFAGVIHNPGPDGVMDTPAATGDILMPGVAGEMGAPGAGGDILGPGASGDMATGIMYPGFSGWIGTGLYAGIASFFG